MNNDIKYKLANAMKTCMLSSPVEKITVKEIAATCGVTRQTFYRNFQDKYDLINWYFDKILMESFRQMGKGQTVYESLVNKFEYIQMEQQGEIRKAPEDMERYCNMWIPRDSFMKENSQPDIKRQPITVWSLWRLLQAWRL